MTRFRRRARAGSVGGEGFAAMSADRTSIFNAFRAAKHNELHRDVLRRTAAENRGAVSLARETLRLEREEMTRAMREHRRAFVRARAQARRDGRQLLKILDNLPRPV